MCACSSKICFCTIKKKTCEGIAIFGLCHLSLPYKLYIFIIHFDYILCSENWQVGGAEYHSVKD